MRFLLVGLLSVLALSCTPEPDILNIPWGSELHPETATAAGGSGAQYQLYQGESRILTSDSRDLVTGFSYGSLVVVYQPVPEERFDETLDYWVAALGRPSHDLTIRSTTDAVGAEVDYHRSVMWEYDTPNGDSISVWLDERTEACEPPGLWPKLLPDRNEKYCVRIYNGALDQRVSDAARQ